MSSLKVYKIVTVGLISFYFTESQILPWQCLYTTVFTEKHTNINDYLSFVENMFHFFWEFCCRARVLTAETERGNTPGDRHAATLSPLFSSGDSGHTHTCLVSSKRQVNMFVFYTNFLTRKGKSLCSKLLWIRPLEPLWVRLAAHSSGAAHPTSSTAHSSGAAGPTPSTWNSQKHRSSSQTFTRLRAFLSVH